MGALSSTKVSAIIRKPCPISARPGSFRLVLARLLSDLLGHGWAWFLCSAVSVHGPSSCLQCSVALLTWAIVRRPQNEASGGTVRHRRWDGIAGAVRALARGGCGMGFAAASPTTSPADPATAKEVMSTLLRSGRWQRGGIAVIVWGSFGERSMCGTPRPGRSFCIGDMPRPFDERLVINQGYLWVVRFVWGYWLWTDVPRQRCCPRVGSR